MVSRFEVAVRLGIPVEMAQRHGIPPKLTEAEFAELDSAPPGWLVQSRANRTDKPVWVQLTCEVCGYEEAARPKKWWPAFSYLTCDFHDLDDLPDPPPGAYREEVDGIGSRFVGIVDRVR